MTRHPHEHQATGTASLAVLTVSDTRTPETDRSGAVACELIERAGHRVFAYEILPDDKDRVRERVTGWIAEPECDGVIVSGGTGISARDRTFEAIAQLLDKRLDGFGELFRALSFEEIGSAAMMTRSVGGIARGKLLFSLPGSTAAVTLGLKKLILPEVGHLLAELRK